MRPLWQWSRGSPSKPSTDSQAYRTWLETEHEWLFYVNNDVLVPDGAIDALAQAMTKDGEQITFSYYAQCQVPDHKIMVNA